MAQSLEDVYCTLLMSDSYLPGAAVLSHSLRDAGTTKKLAVLVTLETLSADTITQLKALYDYVIPVERIRSPNLANLYLMGRPDLAYAFTKIALWRQTRFRKIVYLDADVVALRALDELFDIEAPFAAAPDIGWPDAFNSGVMVLTPDMSDYWALHTLAASGESFDGADQGLLNQYYENRPWQRLKFTYNTTPNAEYQWEPAYQYYKKDISAVHFIGKTKPWSNQHAGRSSGSGVYKELLAHWWAVHDRHAQSETEAKSAQSTTAHAQDSHKQADDIDQAIVEPTPTAQLSAPDTQWDATRFEPPVQSKPEAANFPTQTYTFSDSHELFKAPGSYPEPPKDMWYKVPESRPKPVETLRPIFPWEQQPDRSRPTRVFAEDLPPEPTSVFESSSPTHAFSTVHYKDDDGTAARETSPGQSSIPKAIDDSWQSFQQGNANAWDNVPGIENYVRAIMDSQTKKSNPQVLQHMTGTQDINSPVLERKNRRESLILTDFPSAVERPSLPVTPAPQKRTMFWGEEKNVVGGLPAATGVPDQTEWDPEEKLEQLRKSSLVEFEHLKKDEHPNPPLRTLPEDLPHVEGSADPKSVLKPPSTGEPAGLFRPGFTMADFGTEFGRSQPALTSPTETRDFAQENSKQNFLELNAPDTNVAKLDVDNKNTPTISTSSSSTIESGATSGNEPSVRSTATAENADPNNKNISADKEEAINRNIPKQGVAKPSEATEGGIAQPDTAALDEDTKKDVAEQVAEEKVTTKQHPIDRQSDSGGVVGKPEVELSSSDNIAKPSSSSSSPQENDKPATILQQEPTGQESTKSPSSTRPEVTKEVNAKQEGPSSPVDRQPSVTEEESAREDTAGRPWKEESTKQSSSIPQSRPAQQGSINDGTSAQPRSTQQVTSSAEGKSDTPSSLPTATSEQDEPAGLFSSIANTLPGLTSPKSSKSQLPSTETFTSTLGQGSALSSFINVGQNLVGLGIAESEHNHSGDFTSTSDRSISHVPSSKQESTTTGSNKSADIPVGDSLRKHHPSHYDPYKGSGLFSQSTSHQFLSGSSSLSPGERLSQQPGQGFKYSESTKAGGDTSSVGSYTSPSLGGVPDQPSYLSQSSSSRPYGSSSYTSQLERLYNPPSAPSSPNLEHFYSTSTERYPSLSGRPFSSSLYGMPTSSASPPLPSYLPHHTSSSRPSSLYSEIPSFSSHHTPTSRPSSYYDMSTTERLSSLYGGGTSMTERPLSFSESGGLSSVERPSLYSGTSSTEKLSSLYNSGTMTTERPSSLYDSVGASLTERPSSLYGGTPTSRRASSSSNPPYTPSLSHSNLHEPLYSSSTSTYKPYSSPGASYSPSLGLSTLHEPSAMHHSLPPSTSFDRGSASRLGHTSHSAGSHYTRSFSSESTAPLEQSSTRSEYSSSPMSSFSHRFSSSISAQSEVSTKDISSLLMEGTYTQQILAGQTRLNVPGFEEDAFRVPGKDHIKGGTESEGGRFSRDSEEERGRRTH